MNNRTKFQYIVTDGQSILGAFYTKRNAESYLKRGIQRDLDGNWKRLVESGFYVRIA